MNIKIKFPHEHGITRVENDVSIEEVFIKQDLMNQKNDRISIGFVNPTSSGILEFNKDEFNRLMETIEDKLELVKEKKILKG